MFELTNISLVLFITTAFNLTASFISWQRRKTQVGFYFALGMFGVTFWTLAAGFDYAAVPIPLKVFFAKLEYTGYNFAFIFFACFALYYAGYEKWLKDIRLRALFIVILISNILLAWTNDWTGWLWVGFVRSQIGENTVFFEHGPGEFWAAVTGYLMILIIIVPLWQASHHGSESSRRQARLIFYAALIPVAGNLLYLFESPQLKGVDWSSLSFSISSILSLLALYSTRFLDIVPIARNEMIERMRDSVLVLDVYDRLVDFNLAAQKNFGVSQSQLGSPINVVMANWPAMKDVSVPDDNFQSRMTILHQFKSNVFDAHITHLVDGGGQVYGKLLVFMDVTKRVQAEQALEQRLREIQELHKNLQETQTQIVEQQRALAAQEERQRMARDLHDSVNQSINGMVLFADTLAAALEKNDIERAHRVMDRLRESARQSLRETRLMLYELQDSGPNGSVDLIQAVENRLAMVESRAGLRTQFIHEDLEAYCPPAWKENLFWIVIEALNNSLKHAQAHQVQVIVRCTLKRLELEIIDDGKGFEVDKVRTGGLGLKHLQERADIIGGTLSIESDLSQGTIVRLAAEIEAE